MQFKDMFGGMSASEVESMFNALDDELDEYFGESGERKRFMKACAKLSNSDNNIIQKVMAKDIPDSRNLAADIENPLRVVDAILMLDGELNTTKNTELLFFLMLLTQQGNVSTALYKARFFDWEQSLLENPHLPAEFIEYLWALNKDSRYLDNERFQILWSIPQNPNCPVNVLKEVFREDEVVVRNAIARHRNIDESLINIFLNSSRLAERQQIAKSKYIPKEALLSLMKDQYTRVSSVAKKQYIKRFPNDEMTNKSIDEAIKKRIKNPYIKSKNPKRKFVAYVDKGMGIKHINSLKPNQRASIAKIAEAEIIEALIDDNSKAVRRAVASSRHCPDEVLQRYLAEPDLMIVNNAILGIVKRRKNTIFEELLSDVSVHSRPLAPHYFLFSRFFFFLRLLFVFFLSAGATSFIFRSR